MRKQLFLTIDKIDKGGRSSRIYGFSLGVVILLSFVPLVIAEEHPWITFLDLFATTVFVIDYVLRWITADFKLKKGRKSFIFYPFSGWAIIDMLSILPGVCALNKGFRILRATRLLRMLKLLRFAAGVDQNKLKGFVFFWQGMKAAKKEMLVSLQVLVALTLLLAIALYFVEHAAQPEVYESLWNSIVWSFMSYLGNAGNFSPGDPVTILGRLIWVVLSIINIAIFAVPAGLIANGFGQAMAEDARNTHLEEVRKKLSKSFIRDSSVTFISFCNQLPDNDPLKGKKIYFVSRYLALVPLQVRLGLTTEDLMETVMRFTEFRMKNLAAAQSVEERAEDKIVIDHFPINTCYGCCVDRGSKITIVSTVGSEEVATGWYAFYLAKLGGFNYVGKDIDVDPEERDNYYKMTDELKVDYKTRAQLAEANADAKMLSKLDEKERHRNLFMDDIKRLGQKEGSWIFFIHTRLKNSVNTNDICFSYSKIDGTDSTIEDQDTMNVLLADFTNTFAEKFQLTAGYSQRYSFLDGYLPYRLREQGCKANMAALGVAGPLVHFDVRRYNVMYTIAGLLRDHCDKNSHITPKDLNDLQINGYGYSEDVPIGLE